MIYTKAARIDYDLLAQAIALYEERGWEQIEVPWVASHEALEATYFDPYFATGKPGQGLLGSAEQGFIELAARDEMGCSGRYMAVSPCFRNEPTIDRLHQPWFLKLELWDTESDGFNKTINDALDVMQILAPKRDIREWVTGEGYDIVAMREFATPLELGSYGRRSAEVYGRTVTWNYGTGLALPRFSLC